ncbi:hypothetical protein AAFF_G00143830 [Aldrovandia affinis]|uniref:Leucine-rich repeat flightless-interacting protein 1-like n=1 Tax=Aldrovandia affinis TaxID=143900 RepID=A0AAD7T2B4_9TELE|nr:hypothetical protein AAFF_G00143830 [Aldrovandia affinis]
MHSGSLEKVGTPRKRTLSRGMSEDESLRHLIKEAEGSARRLTRADSKMGSVKKPDRGENQTEEDLITNFPGMLDLQESYDEVVQELRGLELQRETLLFQVDCLQDALEGAEEMLAELRREAADANAELGRERQVNKRLEEAVSSLEETVSMLTEEVQRLKEKRVAIPTVPVYTIVTNSEPEGEGHVTEREGTGEEDGRTEEEPEKGRDALEELEETFVDAPLSVIRLDSIPAPITEGVIETTAGSILASFFRKGKEEQPAEGGHPPLQSAHQGSSVDSEDDCHTRDDAAANEESPLTKFQRMFKNITQMPTMGAATGPPQDGVLGRQGDVSPGADPFPGLTDAAALQGPPAGGTPMDTEDKPSQTAPLEGTADTGATLDEEQRPAEDGEIAEGPIAGLQGELLGRKDGAEPRSPKSPDSCVVS